MSPNPIGSKESKLEVRLLPDAYPSYENVPTVLVDISSYNLKKAEIWGDEPVHIRRVHTEIFKDFAHQIESNLVEYNYKIDLLADILGHFNDDLQTVHKDLKIQADNLAILNETLTSINKPLMKEISELKVIIKEIEKEIKENEDIIKNEENLNCSQFEVERDMQNRDSKKIVISALEDPKYHWRTAIGIARETSLTEELVGEILDELILEGNVVRANRPKGLSVFTTRNHYNTSRNWLIRLFSSLSNRIL